MPMTDNQNGSASPLILGAKQQPNFVVQNLKPVVVDHFNRKDPKPLVDTKLADLPKQFENSYQFEVMFVKKVKVNSQLMLIEYPAQSDHTQLSELLFFNIFKLSYNVGECRRHSLMMPWKL